jgi:glutamate-5-semialdehyde dehydrogenase
VQRLTVQHLKHPDERGLMESPKLSSTAIDPALLVRSLAEAASEASMRMGTLTTAQKNAALAEIAAELRRSADSILAANSLDMQEGQRAGLGAKLDRLMLTRERIEAICRDIDNVIRLPDPIGQEISRTVRPNSLVCTRVRVPLGVVGIIYEARPNVTVDASVLCLKSGNAVLLKGGSDALHSNRAVVDAIQRALGTAGVPRTAVQLIDSADRAATQAFLDQRGLIDVIIPRGSLSLIRFTQEHARVPVIETGASVVHAYVDEDVDAGQAAALLFNAKHRRVSICGALDVALFHRNTLESVARPLAQMLASANPPVQIRADARALPIFAEAMPKDRVKALDPETDYDTEWLDYILAARTVDSLDEALAHIRIHSLRHTEAIYTRDAGKAQRFLAEVDAAVVMHNASTQFTDGAEFGLGAEIGISTQKLHVRGPFALEGLTSMKWHIVGTGQVRP